MNDAKEFVSIDDAIKRLPDGDMIHTFRAGPGVLVGADHERDRLIADMRKAPNIEVTGPGAQAMHHGLAIFDEHGVLFIETRTDAAHEQGGAS